MEHARQERVAVGQCHWVVDHEVGRSWVDLALCRVIEHASGEVPREVHVDIELLAGARLRDGVVVVVAKQDQPPAARELRSDGHAFPFLSLLATGQQCVGGDVDEHRTLRDGDDAGWKSVGTEWNRRDVTRAGDVDLVDAFAADGAGADRVVDADAAVVPFDAPGTPCR